jgi:hypothetical protein
MSWSVRVSMLAVASSTRTRRLSRSRARAMHTSCFSPTDRLSPAAEMGVFSPSRSAKAASTPHFCSASNRRASACSARGSRFYRRVPSIRTGYCAISVMLERRSRSDSSAVLFLSTKTAPAAASTSLRIDPTIVDLPAPVLPTIPIFSPAFTLKLSSLSTDGSPGL